MKVERGGRPPLFGDLNMASGAIADEQLGKQKPKTGKGASDWAAPIRTLM